MKVKDLFLKDYVPDTDYYSILGIFWKFQEGADDVYDLILEVFNDVVGAVQQPDGIIKRLDELLYSKYANLEVSNNVKETFMLIYKMRGSGDTKEQVIDRVLQHLAYQIGSKYYAKWRRLSDFANPFSSAYDIYNNKSIDYNKTKKINQNVSTTSSSTESTTESDENKYYGFGSDAYSPHSKTDSTGSKSDSSSSNITGLDANNVETNIDNETGRDMPVQDLIQKEIEIRQYSLQEQIIKDVASELVAPYQRIKDIVDFNLEFDELYDKIN